MIYSGNLRSIITSEMQGVLAFGRKETDRPLRQIVFWNPNLSAYPFFDYLRS
ncbi:hypothetical protein [Bacteroides acidifaciens]|uniref:hypothetical protein n=1 Tax=Bacteroides acidifaciens TaxID=85831 RepID=UPI0026E0BFE0|nr:hypothetical protein [Bacteroides acidifaciens]